MTEDWEGELLETFNERTFDRAVDLVRILLTTRTEQAVAEERKRVREVIRILGQQQEDDTIWCKMDDLLTALQDPRRGGESKEECSHEWRPILSRDMIDMGYGSCAAQIGSYCMKCKKES